MATLYTPVALSSALLLAAVLCYREGRTPPRPVADGSIRVDAGIKRLVTTTSSRRFLAVSRYIIYAHFLTEIYGLWAKSGQAPLNLESSGINNICPLAGPNTVQSIYPNKQLPPSAFASLALIIVGGLLRGTCHRRLGRMFTWETSILQDHKLITNGPYQFVRHPSYTGLLCVAIGYSSFLWIPGTVARECFIGSNFPPTFNAKSAFGLMFAVSATALDLDVAVFLVRRSFVEDKMLKKEFGKDWEEWARKVRYNVIPFVL